jgi:hypothetical protein
VSIDSLQKYVSKHEYIPSLYLDRGDIFNKAHDGPVAGLSMHLSPTTHHQIKEKVILL